MKTRFTLECAEEFDFAVLAINSHIKGYKLCWNINSSMQLNFEKKRYNKRKKISNNNKRIQQKFRVC